ncbi:hypothetical protein [Mammaliicoccus fleurettii]|nr:hypothetical protein [Mammaliicoccus fleurettii]MEB7781269.1 hypothetical protein [Mammaliicoccus fleurettii]MEB8067378.1 hypothetical protein [Mammaliicoccus fleurettii]
MKFESYEIIYKGRTYNGIIASKLGKYLFYKMMKNNSFFQNKVKINRKIQ